MAETISKVGVVGLGVMGFDIAFLYAMKGFQTLAYDAAKGAMDVLDTRREQTIDRLAKRNRISDSEAANVRRLLQTCQDLGGLSRVDLITEAVSEDSKTKCAVYRALRGAGFSGILTTNTSSVTRATLLGGTDYVLDKFALTHFFNPVLYTQMVEVVKGDMEAVHGATMMLFLETIGRQPVETEDISGFVSNGILMVYAVMALRLLESGARVEQIDQAAKDLKVLPPLISFDSWKPSIVEDVTRVMFELRGDRFLRSSSLLTRLAKENTTFYADRSANTKIYDLAEVRGRSLDDESVKRALWTSMIIAAARVAELGESPATIDFIATEGIKMPEPPLKYIDTAGVDSILEQLAKTNSMLGGQPLAAPELLIVMANEKESFYLTKKTNPWLLDHQTRTAMHARH